MDRGAGEGTVSAISPAPLASGSPTTSGTGGAAAGPTLARTATVAPPSHDLAISTLDSGVAVLNRTTNALTTVAGGQQTTTPLPLAGLASLAPRTDGAAVRSP